MAKGHGKILLNSHQLRSLHRSYTGTCLSWNGCRNRHALRPHAESLDHQHQPMWLGPAQEPDSNITFTQAHTLTHTHMHARMHTHMHARMHTPTRTHTHTQPCTRTRITRTHARTHARTHTHTPPESPHVSLPWEGQRGAIAVG